MSTVNLALPEIVTGQANTYITQNQDLHMLDALVMCAVVDKDLNTAPVAATSGSVYIIGPSPTGAAWAGKAGKLAHRDGTQWKYYTPKEGWQCFVKDENKQYVYTGTAWVVAWSL